MTEMIALLKPAPFKGRKFGNPGELLMDFQQYVKTRDWMVSTERMMPMRWMEDFAKVV